MTAATATAWAERVREADELLHAVSGPLSVIRGQCHAIVRAGNRRQELIERLRLIDRELDRLAGSTERVLRLLAGEPTDETPQRVDLLAVIRDAANRYAAAAAERGVALRVEAHARHGEVIAHAEAIDRMVDSLLHDALAHAPVGSAVTLALTERGSRAVVRVIDERSVGAHGVGWAIAGGLAARCKGSLTCEPVFHGASLRIELPLLACTKSLGAA